MERNYIFLLYAPLFKKIVLALKPFLSQVEGVSEIRVIGGKTKEFWLTLNIQKMNTLGITPDLINTALNQTNFIKSNGYLSDYRLLYLTVTDASVTTVNQLENITELNIIFHFS